MSKPDSQAKAASAADATPQAGYPLADLDHELKSMETGIKQFDHYGDGCLNGHQRAHEWLANPQRCNPAYGGTLQEIVLEYADLMRHARGKHEIDYIRGLIVGFCYAIECPSDAAACLAAGAVRDAREEVWHG